ncbi:hypothetical protein IMZ48_21875 [Candidatus Bathyarchaeota archaeon]|nr:hypothetical protein [Candidatus Bathyarchaeota archaeon]
MLIYAGTENFVTIICASLPVLRPLWLNTRDYDATSDSSGKRSYLRSRFGSNNAEAALEGNGPSRMITRIFTGGRGQDTYTDTGSEEIILQETDRDKGGREDGTQVYCRTEFSVNYSK